MKQIQSITDDPKQKMTFILENGDKVIISLEFISGQKGWFLSLEYGSFKVRNRRVVTSPNMLRAFKNILPFGIACITADKQEPIYKDDFSTGRAEMFILNETDIDYVETNIIPEYRG